MLKNLLFFATIGITFCCASVPDIYNERELTGKVALITGAAQGIGKSIAKKFLEANVELIIILDKEAELGEQTSEEFNAEYGENKTVFIACHIATDFDKIADEIINKFGYIDILVNNAALVEEYEPDVTIETNLLALVKWSWKFYNIMRQDRGGSCGTIINISSIAGYLIQPFFPIYSATKYSVIGYTRDINTITRVHVSGWLQFAQVLLTPDWQSNSLFGTNTLKYLKNLVRYRLGSILTVLAMQL